MFSATGRCRPLSCPAKRTNREQTSAQSIPRAVGGSGALRSTNVDRSDVQTRTNDNHMFQFSYYENFGRFLLAALLR
jgi:hypothetical protein